MSGPAPEAIERLPERRLRIRWSDGVTLDYSSRALRDACPCATCREKKRAPAPSPMQLTVLPVEETAPVDIAAMRPAGSYAYVISFNDGHTNGIFTFDLLRQLGSESPDASAGAAD